MNDDPKRIVASSYDRIARRYLGWDGGAATRLDFLARFTDLLAPDAAVLEVGCGAGVPVSRALADRGFRVTGIDISAAQIALARERVPEAEFIEADMTALDFAPSRFDAASAFYALIHVPRAEQAPLLGRIATWLRPGGVLLATMGASDEPGTVLPDWLGAPMYYSHFDAATNRALVEAAGFALIDAPVVTHEEDGVPVSFLWVLARRMGG